MIFSSGISSGGVRKKAGLNVDAKESGTVFIFQEIAENPWSGKIVRAKTSKWLALRTMVLPEIQEILPGLEQQQHFLQQLPWELPGNMLPGLPAGPEAFR